MTSIYKIKFNLVHDDATWLLVRILKRGYYRSVMSQHQPFLYSLVNQTVLHTVWFMRLSSLLPTGAGGPWILVWFPTRLYRLIVAGCNMQAAVQLACSRFGARSTAGLPSLTILHGVLGSRFNWRSLVKRLALELDRTVSVPPLNCIKARGYFPYCPQETCFICFVAR